jgi:hypothetical protein
LPRHNFRAGESQAHPAQQVVSQCGEGHDQIIGVELARRQALLATS